MVFRSWSLPDADSPVEIYIVESYGLELVAEQPADVVLRAVPDAWPFPPHARTRAAPAVVAALDLAEALEASCAELSQARLAELAETIDPSWQRRPQRRRRFHPIAPSSAHALRPHPRLQHSASAAAAGTTRPNARRARSLRCDYEGQIVRCEARAVKPMEGSSSGRPT